MVILRQLMNLVGENPPRIEANLNPHWRHILTECFQLCFNSQSPVTNYESYIFKITSVLDYLHEKLNTGHWSDVPVETRRNFTTASFVKTLMLLKSVEDISAELLRQCIKTIDMGILLGAPLEENSDLLTSSAKFLQIQLNNLQPEVHTSVNNGKRKPTHESYEIEFDNLQGELIEELTVPSIETFNKHFFTPQKPVKLKGCIDHWPASRNWLDLNYLLKVAGDRTIPIEVGSHYTDENWSQKLMTLKEFISKHYLSESGEGNIGYLAQHNLFDQISELRDDIRIPDYCCCSLNYDESTDPDINAWLGPKGTVSPLHQDPKNNILAQVYGTKRLVLFAPEDTEYLYPHGEKMLSNTAQIDPLMPDYSQFPDYKKAKMFKCLLRPGEMLFIPVKWWHHVTAFQKSFSVSFWWQ